MIINFFEEFPEQGPLEKARFITHDCVVYIAALSIMEFKKFEEELKGINPRLSAAWWPVLPESYWVSPFSLTWELQRLSNELASYQGNPLRLLLDLELPLLRPYLFTRNIFSFRKNRRIIGEIFTAAVASGHTVATAEYPFSGRVMTRILRFLGVTFPLETHPHVKILMYYSSMYRWPRLQRYLKKQIRAKAKHYGSSLQVGLGTIDTGIFGTEPILTPEGLYADLRFLAESAVSTAIIFRLSGMDERYAEVTGKFAEVPGL